MTRRWLRGNRETQDANGVVTVHRTGVPMGLVEWLDWRIHKLENGDHGFTPRLGWLGRKVCDAYDRQVAS